MADDATPQDDQAKPEEEKKEDQPAPAADDKKDAPAEDAKSEDKPEDDKPSKEYSKEVEDIVGKVEKMTVLEVADLVSAIEDKFGVSAAPVAVAGAAPAAGGDADGGEDEKSAFTIHLAATGDKKIEVIKAVREITDLGLGEAKALVDEAPKDVKADVPADDAKEAKAKLEAAGATVELK